MYAKAQTNLLVFNQVILNKYSCPIINSKFVFIEKKNMLPIMVEHKVAEQSL